MLATTVQQVVQLYDGGFSSLTCSIHS